MHDTKLRNFFVFRVRTRKNILQHVKQHLKGKTGTGKPVYTSGFISSKCGFLTICLMNRKSLPPCEPSTTR